MKYITIASELDKGIKTLIRLLEMTDAALPV